MAIRGLDSGVSGLPSSVMSSAGMFLVTFLGYLAMGLLGMGYTGGSAVAPIWPAAGVALAALLTGGVRLWPAVWLGAFASATITTGHFHWVSVATASGATMSAIVPVLLLRRFVGAGRELMNPGGVVVFMTVVLLVGCPLAALLGVGALNISGSVADARFVKAVYVWWAGDSAGIMLLSPILLVMSQRRWMQSVRARFPEFAMWTLGLAGVAGIVFFDLGPGGGPVRGAAFFSFPLIVAVAWSFGVFGGAWATLIAGTIAMVGTTAQHGPLLGGWAGNDPSMVLVFIITVALTAMLLGAYKSNLETEKERVTRCDRQLSQAQAIGGIGSWFWDTETDNVIWSAGSHRLFAIQEDRVEWRFDSMLERLHPDDRRQFKERLDRVRAGGESDTWECRVVRPDGEEHILLSTAALHGGDVAGTTMDITGRRRLEAQQSQLQRKMQETQKLESLGVLAGGIAHDFNNILTGVMGNASLLRLDLPPDSPHIQSVRKIEAAAERAADLCRQMLAYAGKGRTHVQPVNLNTVVHESQALLKASMRSGKRFECLTDEEIPPTIADPGQIRQVVLNLVLNASEALASEGGLVTVRTRLRRLKRSHFRTAYLAPDLPDGDYVVLEVRDNGFGMGEDIVGKIFDPFFTTKFAGRGLGLPAVAGIVRSHNGAIFVRSEAGVGTMVEVAFPAAKSAPAMQAMSPQKTDAMRPGRVLVVDDEADVRNFASEALARAGHTVDVASDGSEAVGLVRANPAGFDMILIDLTMPRMGGMEAITEIRAAGCKVPIIIMSGYDRDETLTRLDGHEVAGFLCKPFTPDSLHAAVRDVGGASQPDSNTATK